MPTDELHRWQRHEWGLVHLRCHLDGRGRSSGGCTDPVTPNILWIFSDELRADALSIYGTRWIRPHTPRLDQLAERSLVFDRFYVSSPICVSSRASIATGLLPERTGVYANEAVWPTYEAPAPAPTFVGALRGGGYTCWDVGKEHVPAAFAGWDRQSGSGSGMSDPYSGLGHDELRLVRSPTGFILGGVVPARTRFEPERVTTEAVAALSMLPEPWLLRASYLQPHTPVVVPEPYASLHASVEWPDERRPADAPSRFEHLFGEINRGAEVDDEAWRRLHAEYYGLVSWLDAQVGALLGALDASGLADRTVIVFGADHGAHLGEHGQFGKHTFAPQSQRVPLLVHHPDPAVAPAQVDDLASGVDLARTFVGIAGLELEHATDGRDLLADPAPEAVVATIGYGHAGSRAFPNLNLGTWDDDRGWPRRSCVRTERWRFDRNTRLDGDAVPDGDRDEALFDTLEDPLERRNVAAAHPDVVASLDRILTDATRNSRELTTMRAVYDWIEHRRRPPVDTTRPGG